MSPELPFDLVEEILSRVPAKSLIRFRLVCKQWNALFNDPRFIKNHKDLALDPTQFIFVSNSNVCLVGNNPDTHHNNAGPSLAQHQLNLEAFGSRVQIFNVFHDKGLLLCSTSKGLVVWNPCLGQTRWIEPQDPRCQYDDILCFECDVQSGNGYRFLSGCPDIGHGFRWLEVFKSPGQWRELDVTLDFVLTTVRGTKVSSTGTWHWVAEGVTTGIYSIQSFDFSTERFEKFCPLPFDNGNGHHHLVLTPLGGDRLSLLRQCYYTANTEIWVTNKIGGGEVVSWRKTMNMTTLTPRFSVLENAFYRPSFFMEGEDKVVVCRRGLNVGILRLYVRGEEVMDGAEIDFSVEQWTSPCLYKSSLIPVGIDTLET